MMNLTTAQKKALIALRILGRGSKRAGYSRIEIAVLAKSQWQGYPVKTMRALQRAGLAQPVCDVAVELVETGQCRCGCDLWNLTDAGIKLADSMDYRQPMYTETFRKDPDDWWKGD